MKALLLYGANCTVGIWNQWKEELKEENFEYVEYPHEVTSNAKSVTDVTEWVYQKYGKESFDILIGHSMGGIIALELAAKFDMSCNKVIFIESNLRPAKSFYRNLMTEENRKHYGDEVIPMLRGEDIFYSVELKKALQEDYDYSDYIKQFSGEVYGIYGDRGVREYKDRYADLCLDEKVENKIQFYFVEDACHLPMIENMKGLAEVIRVILLKKFMR
ncbi:hypothetical protein lbkm_4107 [Lachnospiraceae bacterium KM106-2]|nr:hypothetical protein lbkm_4107 [Lachnospiraceae bacterium KM106-2]